jgi:hypothetical protein
MAEAWRAGAGRGVSCPQPGGPGGGEQEGSRREWRVPGHHSCSRAPVLDSSREQPGGVACRWPRSQLAVDPRVSLRKGIP